MELRVVMKFGTGAHITVPKEWIGKKVYVLNDEDFARELALGRALMRELRGQIEAMKPKEKPKEVSPVLKMMLNRE